jgi:hypothetical protein
VPGPIIVRAIFCNAVEEEVRGNLKVEIVEVSL